jgi:hypothetical protein
VRVIGCDIHTVTDALPTITLTPALTPTPPVDSLANGQIRGGCCRTPIVHRAGQVALRAGTGTLTGHPLLPLQEDLGASQ